MRTYLWMKTWFEVINYLKHRPCYQKALWSLCDWSFPIWPFLCSLWYILYSWPTIDHYLGKLAAQVLTKTKLFEHITLILKPLHWLPVCQRIDLRILLLTYKSMNGLGSKYMTEMLLLHEASSPLDLKTNRDRDSSSFPESKHNMEKQHSAPMQNMAVKPSKDLTVCSRSHLHKLLLWCNFLSSSTYSVPVHQSLASRCYC